MTVKVAGTTVIEDNRELQNISSLTVNGTSFIDVVSDSSIITTAQDASNIITINAALGNHYATSVFDSLDFGVIYTKTYTTTLGFLSDNKTYTIDLPTYLKSGDIVRVVITAESAQTNSVDVSDSFTKTTVREFTASNHCSYVYSKAMTSTLLTSFTITNNLPINTLDVSIVVFVTRLEVTNYSVSSSTGNSTSGAITLTPLAITNATAGVVLVYGFTNTNASSTTISAPVGFTLIGKANQTGSTAIVGFLRITSTQTVTPGAFLGTFGTGVWSAFTDSRQVITGSGNPSVTFTNVPTRYSCTLELDYYGGTISWPSGVRWDTFSAPTFQKNTKNLILFTTYNSGTTWYATVTQGYSI